MQRRRFLGGLVLGSAGLVAASRAIQGAEAEPGTDLWPLFAPLEVGSSVGLGWQLESLSPVRVGRAVLTLCRGEQRAVVHLSARGREPHGVASSGFVDFVLMNDGDGQRRTEEDLGRVIASLAMLVSQNEDAALVAQAGLSPHRSASLQTSRA